MFIGKGSFLAEKQKQHPPTCSTMRSPSVNSARRHQMGATFGYVAQPRGQTEGRQDVEGIAAYMEEG